MLHKLGLAEGEPRRYKPIVCSLFPLEENERGEWYVRQWGVEDEAWQLFCLNPAHSKQSAAETLREEIALLRRWQDEAATLPFPSPGAARESA